VSGSGGAECLRGHCGWTAYAPSAPCQNCLGANIGLNNIGLIFQACAQGSGSLTFGGRNGVILLSKQPFTQKDVLKFDSFLLQRVALYGQTTVAGAVTHAFCTHLQAGLGSVKYNGKLGGWQQEQAAEIDELVKWVGAKAGSGRAVLLGDMNCGPAVAEARIDAEFADNFAKFTAAGLAAPWLAGAVTQCTWCKANLLAGSSEDRVIDHALFKGWPAFGDVQRSRIGEAKVAIDLAGGATDTQHSDHFGARLTVSLP